MSDIQGQGFVDNPMLLNPLNTGQQSAPAVARMTQPFPVVLRQEPVCFKCSMLNHHMHRPDGKRLAFMHGILETKDEYDIQYLENEIRGGNPFISWPTELEVNHYRMRTDPKGTMTRQLTPEIEAKVRVDLESKIRKEMEDRLNKVGIVLTDEQKQKFFDAQESARDPDAITRGMDATTDASDSSKLQGSDALDRLRANFTGGIKSGTGTVVMNSSDAAEAYHASLKERELAKNQGATLQQSSITGSDKTVNFAKSAEEVAAERTAGK